MINAWNDAALDAQPFGEPGQWARRPLGRNRAVSQHDVVAVDCLQPVVQEMQHCLGSRLGVWVRMQQRAAERGGFGY